MTLILLGAVLADRPALTMRNLALAALAVVVSEPEALLGPSFQLSFAAVAALIAVYEHRQRARPRRRKRPERWRGALSRRRRLRHRRRAGRHLLRHLGHGFVHGL